jgi:L-serine/L-threonine ammonia-lyase
VLISIKPPIISNSITTVPSRALNLPYLHSQRLQIVDMTIPPSTGPRNTNSTKCKPGPSDRPPWIKTPCIASESLSAAAGCQVFAKLDLLQPSGSFKIRGVGNMIWQTVQRFADPSRPLHFYSSSRGNAGLAAATAAKRLGQKATVVVPKTTAVKMMARIEAAGAEVIEHGVSLSEADECARALAAAREDAAYVPPFDHELIWEGKWNMEPLLLAPPSPRFIKIMRKAC